MISLYIGYLPGGLRYGLRGALVTIGKTMMAQVSGETLSNWESVPDRNLLFLRGFSVILSCDLNGSISHETISSLNLGEWYGSQRTEKKRLKQIFLCETTHEN